jgi:hypothetical protein
MRPRALSLRPLRGALFVVTVAFALPVSADAPTSGPDRQYESFTEADREIIDHFTRLHWERPNALLSAYPPAMNYAAALQFCANGARRLPSMKELLTIVDEEPHPEYDTTALANTQRMIDKNAFLGTPPEPFWTSSRLSNGQRATVHFGTGLTLSADETDVRRVRCVTTGP